MEVVDGGSIIGLAIPDFWFGLLLIVGFAVNLGWFPPTGY
jgi:peptide/nickel transport system permease protein